jgi:hypothetical protein
MHKAQRAGKVIPSNNKVPFEELCLRILLRWMPERPPASNIVQRLSERLDTRCARDSHYPLPASEEDRLQTCLIKLRYE